VAGKSTRKARRAAKELLHRRAAIATLVSVPIALGGLVFAILQWSQGRDSTTSDQAVTGAPSPKPDLRLVAVEVLNTSQGGATPALQVKLHNQGSARVVVHGASIEVERAVPLDQCHNQGELPLSGTYDVSLPTSVSAVEVPLNQQLGPDEADRFALRFGFDDETLGRGPERGGASRSYVVQIRVSLHTDDQRHKVVSLGEFVFGVPLPPGAVTQYWPASLENVRAVDLVPQFGEDFPWDDHMECWQTNTERLRAVLNESGSRSETMRQVASNLANTVVAPR
jgi:hypothetical protein